MAIAISIKNVEKMIIEEFKNKDREIKKIRCYKISKKMYLFNLICSNRKIGELRLHKSAIKHIANNTEGNIPFKYLVHNEIYWSV